MSIKKIFGLKIFRLKNKGFTILEILVATAILGISVSVWLGGITPMLKQLTKGKDRFDLAIEQRAVTSLLEGASETAVRGALCFDPAVAIPEGYPHPYGKLKYDGSCETLRAWTTAERTSWENLADKVFGWQGASSGVTLDSIYYNAQIVPAMNTAGCLNCHGSAIPKTYTAGSIGPYATLLVPPLTSAYMNSARPELGNRNFNNYSHMVADPFIVGLTSFKPLATRAILLSPLAEMFFRTSFEIKKLIPNTTNSIVHRFTFKVEKTNLTIPSFNSIAMTGSFCSATGPTTAICGSPPPSACSPSMGEVYDASTCSCFCTAWTPPPVCSCGKGCVMTCSGWTPSCASWQTQYSCISPSKVASITVFGKPGNVPTMAPYNPPAWQTVSDSYCATTLGQCDSAVCGGTPSASACVQAGSCQRICTAQTWGAPSVCGKGCIVPAAPTSCIEQKVQFTCRYPLPAGTTESAILTYMVNSQLLDNSGAVVSTIVTSGAMK